MFGQNLNVILNNEKYIESVVGGSENAKKFKWNSQNKTILAVGVTIGAALAVCIASYGIVLLAGRLKPELFYKRERCFKEATIPFRIAPNAPCSVRKPIGYTPVGDGSKKMQLCIAGQTVKCGDTHQLQVPLSTGGTMNEHYYPASYLNIPGTAPDEIKPYYTLPYQINSIEDVHNLYPELCGIKYTATSPLSNFLTKLPFVARVCQSSMESSIESSRISISQEV